MSRKFIVWTQALVVWFLLFFLYCWNASLALQLQLAGQEQVRTRHTLDALFQENLLLKEESDAMSSRITLLTLLSVDVMDLAISASRTGWWSGDVSGRLHSIHLLRSSLNGEE
jgi:Tfp pilus assembly protein PilN